MSENHNQPLLVSDFDFHLPEELIAQQPPEERGTSRMLVVDRATGELHDSSFSAFPSLLRPGDLLVLNDSRVIPARLYARRTLRREKEPPTGRIEVMLTEPQGSHRRDSCLPLTLRRHRTEGGSHRTRSVWRSPHTL
jgi:S-adenosylmethionine:tRNA ribosyltransferase-isomerase